MTFLGNVREATLAYSSSPLLRDSTVWAGFGIQLPRSHGNDRSDNFIISVVPEPGMTTLAAIGACLLRLRRRPA